MSATIEDVQSSQDTRQIPINKVGIKDIRHPVRVRDRSAGEQHTIASFNMYVNLPHNFKGTHMSRFVEILKLRGDPQSPRAGDFRGILPTSSTRPPRSPVCRA